MVLANNTLRNILKNIRVYKNTIKIYTKTMLICTVAHKCHVKKEKLTAKKKSSQQKRKAHGKKENLTAKKKRSRQNRKARGGCKNSRRK